MHRELRNSLTDAEGESDQVVVVFLDVRGFSSFAGMAESSQAALFLRAMYLEVLNNYFPTAAFFKPTGDGLMLIMHFDRHTLADVLIDAISAALRLVDEFEQITADDPMVNFKVPGELGIGIARGAATRLSSGDYTLDYSGRPLNLAARLMDLARPRGVVVEGDALKGIELPDELSEAFTTESVFVKGIADLEPISVLRSADVTIKSQNRRPLIGTPYEQKLPKMTFKEASALSRFIHSCDKEPLDPDSVRLEVGTPAPRANGTADPEMGKFVRIAPVEVRRSPNGWDVVFDYSRVTAFCAKNGAKSTWAIQRKLLYSVAEVEGDPGLIDAVPTTGDEVAP